MPYSPRPHVSGALVQLRTTVTWSAMAVILAAVLQMLSFGFVHFTDVRWTVLETPPTAQQLTVVTAEPGTAEARSTRAGRASRGARQVQTEPEKVLSRWDGTLRTFTDASASIGLISAATLWVAVGLGTVVAGGGSVPGVEQTVRASTWATVLGFSSLPLIVNLPGLPLNGTFVSYQTMLAASEGSQRLDTVALLASHVALPLIAAVLAGYTLLCFREGVEAGVIVRSVSELDRKLDKELETIRSTGIGSNHGQRTVGVVDRPMGDDGSTEADRPKSRSWVSDRDRGMGDARPGNPLRRPM
ncbi:hypothetical protein AY599_16260 [Leptolyngbya valderiana BDU 20041]|nr:hypothetical protein AY599_16260 [Leptolyngbya valderiana BDU 20041]